MDRRKSEIHEQYHSLKQECETTVDLLKKLLQMCSSQLDVIDKLDSKSFRRYSKFFLAIIQFHSLSKQKILEYNFDLEEFLAEQCIPEPESLEIKSSQNSSCSIAKAVNLNTSISLSKEPGSRFEYAQQNKHELEGLTTNEAQEEKLLCVDTENEFCTFRDNLNDSLTTCDFYSTSSFIEDKNEQGNLSLKDKQKSLSKGNSEITKPSEVLDSLPVMTIEEKCSKSLFESSKLSEGYFQPEILENQSSATEERCSENIICEKSVVDPLKKSDEIINNNKTELTNNSLTNRITPLEKYDNQVLQNAGNVTKLIVNQTNEESLPESKIINVLNRIAPNVGDACMIGHVESPREFYIQVADQNAYLIDDLPNKLSALYDNAPFIHSSKTNSMKSFGNFYAAFIEDCWYRVEVTNWRLSDEKYVVIQLIDYGHKYDINYSDLYPLTEDLCKIPKMAQQCHLAYLYPPSSTKENRFENWTEDTMEKILDILGDLNESSFCLQHVYYCKERNSYEVDLTKLDESNDAKTIGEILIENGLAVQIFDNDSEVIRNRLIVNQIKAAQGLIGIHSNMSEEEILDIYFKQTLQKEAENINEAVMHYNPRDEAETCKNLRPDGTCYKGKKCRFRHVPLTSGYTMDKVPVYDKAFEDDILPQTGEDIVIIISHVENIQHFYVQIIKENKSVVNSNQTLSGLIKIMNDPERRKQYEKLKYPPSLGQMVIVKHWNGHWYRGQVRFVDIPENNDDVFTEVYIVDFGDRIRVPMTDLRTMIPEYLHLSFQAVECRLYNVKQKPGIKIEDEKTYFESTYLSETLKAHVMGSPGYLEVLLEDDKGNDIGLKLIEAGFGELRTEHCFPCDSEFMLID